MSGEPKVMLMKLFERTSERGTRYLFGRLGAAKIVAFIDTDAELQYGATAVFDVYVQAVEDKAAPAAAIRAPRRRAPYPRQQPHGEPAGDPRPFDDDVSDVGR